MALSKLQGFGNRALSWAPFIADERAVVRDKSEFVRSGDLDTSAVGARRTFKLMTGFGLLGAGAALLVLSIVAGVAPQALFIAGIATGGAGAAWMLALAVRNQFASSGRGVFGFKIGNHIPEITNPFSKKEEI